MLPVLVAAGAFLISAVCPAAEFSADMVQKTSKKTIKGKMYVKGDKLRQEITQGGEKEIVIFRPDKKVVWFLQPGKKTYMKVSQRIIIGVDDPAVRARMKRIGTMKKLGTAKLNGYTCNKIQWSTKSGAKYVLTEWTSDKLKIAVKSEFKEPSGVSSVEYKNIKEGGVSDSVFELPKGYKRVQTPTAPPASERR